MCKNIQLAGRARSNVLQAYFERWGATLVLGVLFFIHSKIKL